MTIVAKHYPLKFWIFRRFGGYVEKGSPLIKRIYNPDFSSLICKVNILPASDQGTTPVI